MSEFIGTKLTMNLGERSYDIIVKSGSLENLYQFARLDRRVAVVTDSGVPAQYAQMVADQCKDAHIITVPQGEASKSFKILESVLKQMLEFGMGRGDLVIAVGGGVAKAVVNVIQHRYPGREVKVTSSQGLRECRKMMQEAVAGKYPGYLLEGMACPGGCVAGAGTMQPIKKSQAAVGLYARQAKHKTSDETEHIKELDKLVD